MASALLTLVALWLFPCQLPNLSRGPHPVGVMTQHIQGKVDKQTAVELMLQVGGRGGRGGFRGRRRRREETTVVSVLLGVRADDHHPVAHLSTPMMMMSG